MLARTLVLAAFIILSTVKLTVAEQAISQPVGQTVLVEFHASWCGPCRRMKPAMERIKKEGFPVRRLDFDNNKELSRKFTVETIPCFICIVDGEVKDQWSGLTSYDALKRRIERAGIKSRVP